MHNQDSLEPIFDWIENAGKEDLQAIMDAIQDRYPLLHPDRDILYVALPKRDCAQKRELLKRCLIFFHKTVCSVTYLHRKRILQKAGAASRCLLRQSLLVSSVFM